MTRTLIGRLTRRPERRPVASTAAELRAMPELSTPWWPRLRVHGIAPPSPLFRWRWGWTVLAPDGRELDTGVALSWPEALLIGQAALGQWSVYPDGKVCQ